MKNRISYLSAPYVVWMGFFVVAPIVLMVFYAFTTAEGEFTMENFVKLSGYGVIFSRSFQLALIATLICLVVGYPIACILAREGVSFQRLAMILIMLPMWINFILRTYAWMSLLENTGIINTFLANIGFFALFNSVFGTDIEYFRMINTQGAVVLGMVYNYLPFMILPIYSVIIKQDTTLNEAAHDLGADGMTVFRRVIFPLSLPGVLSGITMVFVPS
ncbi:MAG: ABC transporter permease, partial [Eubacteriales bacterium]